MAAHTWVTAEQISATKLNTLETAAWNAGSVMTTLGDVLYGAASGTATRLAGNTTTTHKYLRSVGDGAASAAPTFAEITKVGTIDTGVWNAGAVTSSGTITATTIAGGSVAGSSLTLESTSGAGTTDYIAFLTGSQVERMRLLTGGALSLGTTSAGTAIDTGLSASYDPIFTVFNPTVNYPGTILLATQNTTNAGAEMGRIHFMNGTNRVASILVGADSAANNDGKFSISVMDTGALSERFLINSNGTLKASAYGAGAATFDASGNISSSDGRLKLIQRPYTPGLNEVGQLQPIVYRWRPESRLDMENEYAGFTAQNVRDALGDLAVGENADGTLNLQDRAILAALVNAINELSARNAALEARLATLEGRKR